MTESQELLAEYVRSGSEPAFRRLVELYSGLVFSTALRLADGDAHRAKDIAQMVFIDLARMAEKLSKNSMLGGWLHRHTCFVASTLLRGERRRRAREQQSLAMNTLTGDDQSHFTAIASDLDEAIQRLGPDDRDVILLRFFEHQNLRTVGDTLGVSENVAQKRVTRALSELRVMLGARGATISVASLGTILTVKAVTAAPAGLTAVLAGGALASTSASLVPIATVSNLKPTLIGMFVVLALTSSFFFLRSPHPVDNPVVLPSIETPVPHLKINSDQAPAYPPPDKRKPEFEAVAQLPPQPVVPAPAGPLAPPLAKPAQPQPAVTFSRYRAQKTKSKIRIDGDSTLHKWSMTGPIIGGIFEFPAGTQIDSVHNILTGLDDGILNAKSQTTVPVRSIKSGHDLMDGIYQEALKEKSFPKIVYTLRQMRLKPDRASGQPFEFDTFGDLAIAGVTNRIDMVVQLEMLNGQLKIAGSVPLKMSDFGIAPPNPNIGLGQMRCADEVTISFDWFLQLDSEVQLQNLALGKIPSSNDPAAQAEVLAKITDGKKEAGDMVLLKKGARWVQIDLGDEYQVYTIALWHAYDVPKTYRAVIIQAAVTPNFSNNVHTLFNNDQNNTAGQGAGLDSDYLESAKGKRISLNGLTTRYLRFYSNGSTDSKMNEYTEIEVYGK